MSYTIEEFIEKSNLVTSLDDLCQLYHKATAHLGYNQLVYTFVTDHENAGIKATHGAFCTFNKPWMDHYKSQDYITIDPIIEAVHSAPYIVNWDNLQKENDLSEKKKIILSEAKEAGLLSGIGIPLHGPRGELAGIGLASSLSDKIADQHTLSKLYILSKQFHTSYCALSGKQKNITLQKVKLTNREIEILKWWASGKTSDEISSILSCTQSNVKWHIKNIYTKLDANEKVFAVTKAIRLGLIFSCPHK